MGESVMRITAAVIALIFSPSILFAQTAFPGNYVERGCKIAVTTENGAGETRTDAMLSGFCSGLVEGVVASGPSLIEPYKFCPPAEWTTKQAVRVFERFLETHPNYLDQPAANLAVAAFREAWPCRKK
jgi:hypothetical protein